jgi:type III secretory pathway component EscT
MLTTGKMRKKKKPVPFWVKQKASMIISNLAGLTLSECEQILRQTRTELKQIFTEPKF